VAFERELQRPETTGASIEYREPTPSHAVHPCEVADDDEIGAASGE
jgi:hypothetical protein